MENVECPFIDECRENRERFDKDREEGIRFRAEVRTSLKGIEKGIDKMEKTAIRQQSEVWEAVGELRDKDTALASDLGGVSGDIKGIKGRTAGMAAAVATVITLLAFLLRYGSRLVGGD